MSKKNCGHYSGIGGQAVLEGVMMKNKDEYAVSVRKQDGNIETKKEKYTGILSPAPAIVTENKHSTSSTTS